MKSIRTNPTNGAPEGDERTRTAARWLGAVFAYVRSRAPAELVAAPVCPQCKQADCLGPHIAANRGGCRMHTWVDVG